jgi:hypothetical protein
MDSNMTDSEQEVFLSGPLVKATELSFESRHLNRCVVYCRLG